MKNKTDFNLFLENELNTEQRKAVQNKKGPLLVVAGAGSGKTRVITARITNLILNHDIDPTSILALTFTNKAAAEMRTRIQSFLSDSDHEVPFIGTFHSYCLRLLKENQHLLETPFFSILDQDDQQKMVETIVERNNLGKRSAGRQYLYQISHIKNQPNPHDSIKAFYESNRILYDVYHAYETEKRASKCLDFDDLLLEAFNLFAKNPEFKKSFQQKVRHILVDEYQDTNVVQHELLKQMSLEAKKKFNVDSLCVVGDEDQSIYSWRGATVDNIINFSNDFAKTSVVKIEQNYRSVQQILDVANQVIKHNVNRNPKRLWSSKQARDRVRILSCLSEYQEGDSIIHLLKTLKRENEKPSVAILYRAHFQSRALEESLIRNSVPYTIIGGVQFYERKEIKDIFAYLRLAANPFDRTSLFRVINTPSRNLGAKFEELFYDRWHQEPFLTFIDVGTKLIEEKKVAGLKKESLQKFLTIFEGPGASSKPSDAILHFLEKTSYLSYLKDAYDEKEAQERIDNIKELLRAVTHFEANNINTVSLFLEDVALMQEKMDENNKKKEPIVLMTLHAAKGLEFDNVILAGLEEGLLPSSRSLVSEDAIEEERRLFYVGITRARERLLLTHSRYRYTYGNMTDQRRSRFLGEIPARLAQTDDCSYLKPPQLQDLFAQWLGTNIPSSVRTFSAATTIKPSGLNNKKAGSSIKNKAPAKTTGSGWRKHQPVCHKKFGAGIVQQVETKGDITILEIKFKSGSKKKIAAQFIQPL